MPTKLRHSSVTLLLLAVGALVLTGFAFGLPRAGSSEGTDRSGLLEVGGEVYRFTPTTCAITDDDFVVAGSGTIEGQTFWVAASGGAVDLSVGPDSETETPEGDELWLRTVEPLDWTSGDGSITASPVMADERDAEVKPMPASLSVTCPLA